MQRSLASHQPGRGWQFTDDLPKPSVLLQKLKVRNCSKPNHGSFGFWTVKKRWKQRNRQERDVENGNEDGVMFSGERCISWHYLPESMDTNRIKQVLYRKATMIPRLLNSLKQLVPKSSIWTVYWPFKFDWNISKPRYSQSSTYQSHQTPATFESSLCQLPKDLFRNNAGGGRTTTHDNIPPCRKNIIPKSTASKLHLWTHPFINKFRNLGICIFTHI